MEDEGADAVVVEDDLASFREQWKKELGGKSGKGSEKASQEKELKLEEDEEDQEDDVHVKARQFFLQGVKYEESGKLYEAIRFYKKAEKLVPNIEYQTFNYTGKNFKVKADNEQAGTRDDNGNVTPKQESVDKDVEDVVTNLAFKF